MYQNGVMPTDEWFEKIKAHVDFKGKTVFDYGCAEGIMCKLASEAGAKRVTGIDNQFDKVDKARELTKNCEGVDILGCSIRQVIPLKLGHYIPIFSMIIHWIGKEEFIRLSYNAETIIVVYRTPSSGYEQQNGIWFPTQEELDELIGVKPIHTEHLLNQGEDKNIVLSIYDKTK